MSQCLVSGVRKTQLEIPISVFAAADKMDREGACGARVYISMLKIVGSKMAENIASRAIQLFGGMGVCEDTLLPGGFTRARFCLIGDGPDEVHMSQIGKLTIWNVLNAST